MADSDSSTVTEVIGTLDTAQPTEVLARLVSLVGDDVGRIYSVGTAVEIGRDPEADIHLANRDISRRHARILRRRAGDYVIHDLNSYNGTQVNGRRVINELPLAFGDKIQIGKVRLFLFTYHSLVEKRLLEAQKMESIGLLAGGIAHDFNNLLCVIQNNMELLRRKPRELTLADEGVSACHEATLRATRQAAELCGQLLGFARRGKIEDRVVDMSLIVDSVAKMINRTFDENISVEVDSPSYMMVQGDLTQLNQVVMNLSLNARDAMPDGGTLRLSLSKTTIDEAQQGTLPMLARGPHILLSVEDDGEGMDEATILRVFEPFFTTKKTRKGTGLGLATAHRIIQRHEGAIDLQSQPGRGATFSVYLPEIALSRRKTTTETDASGEANGAERLVLVIDDEDLVRISTRLLLEDLGYRVMAAASGVEAIQLFMEHPFQVVLLDLVMPDSDTEEVFDQLRQVDPDVRVVLISARDDADLVERLTAAGARGVVQKPFTGEAIDQSIARALS